MTCPNCRKPDEVEGGYKNGTDLTWCKHCGLIRWASDGLIPASMYGRDDHAKYCQRVLGLQTFGCAIEANNDPNSLNRDVGRCKNWCGHHYCATTPNLAYVEPGTIEYDSWRVVPLEPVALERWGKAEPGTDLLLQRRADGYWTPWHIAQAALDYARGISSVEDNV